MAQAGFEVQAQADDWLTLLFTDVEGSTALVQSHGTEYDDILALHFRILREAVTENGGREVIAHSDAFFAVFRGAHSALHAAVTMQKRLAAQTWPAEARVRVRIGLHTGSPIAVSDANIGYVGLDVHRAARIADAGNGGQILLSSATYAAIAEADLPEDVVLRYAGMHRLKDLHYPEHIYEAVRPGQEDSPPIRSLETRPSNLPPAQTSFIGRASEVQSLAELLTEGAQRIVTLTGPGGAGKTRLSLEVARGMLGSFPDGVLQVSLGAITDPRLVVPTIAQVLGVPEFPGRSVMDGLKHAIGRRRMLLLVDNFEQVIGAAPELSDLVGACPNLRLLVTSREALRVTAEREFRVTPLRVPGSSTDSEPPLANEAVQLFIDRAREINPGFTVTEHTAPLAAEICRRLDGLPLAIELAASRLRVLGLRGLHDRLGAALNVLGRTVRDADERHSTLRRAIAWSYDLLEPAEQRVFSQLSVFMDGFDLASAEAVCASRDTLEHVTSLCDKSLLVSESADGEPRFRILETIREFGLERLSAAGLDAEVRARHAARFLDMAERLSPDLVGPDQRSSVSRILTEADNIRAAIRWALDRRNVGALARLSRALLWFWVPQGRFTEGRAWLDEAVAVARGSDPSRERAEILDVAGWLRMLSGDYAGALPIFEEALDLYRTHGDADDVAGAEMSLGITVAVARGAPEGPQMILEALGEYRRLGNVHGAGLALIALGEGARANGDDDSAARCYAEALEMMRRAGDMYWTGALLLNMTHVSLHHGDWQAATSFLTEVLSVAQEFNYPMVMNLYVALVGELALRTGRTTEAAELFGAASALLGALGVTFEPADQADFARSMSMAREALGDDGYRAAFDAGSRWTREQAITATFAILS